MRETLARFLRRFAHLYDSGVPLAEALDLVGREFSPPLSQVASVVVDDLYRGTGLTDALERHHEHFGPTVLGVLRNGEQRGELGSALRSAADGLLSGVLEPVPFPDDALDAFLAAVGETRVLELDAGDPVAAALLLRGGEEGGFVRNGMLIRVARSGMTVVARFSGAPGAEPEEARRWRLAPPSPLIVTCKDPEPTLRSILAACPGRRVAVGLPGIPEALAARDLDHALALAPDFLCLAALRTATERDVLLFAVESGIHVLAAAPSARLFAPVPHVELP